MKTEEKDLLDGSYQRKPTSWPLCQILFSDAMDGLNVTIAPEELINPEAQKVWLQNQPILRRVCRGDTPIDENVARKALLLTWRDLV